MSRFTDHLWRDLVREHGPTLAHAHRAEPGRARGAGLLRRPRVFAGGTLGLAGAGAALVLALSAGGATAPSAFAITREADGSVLVKLNYTTPQYRTLAQLDGQLSAMGIHESVTIDNAASPATVSGPVTCTAAPGVTGPTVRVLEGTDGTQVIAAGQSAGNTAEGSFHLVSCSTSDTGPGNTGNTGAG